MKKTLVAAGVIIALGVIWTGGAWYTGKQLESRLDEMVSRANSELKRTAPETNVELVAQNYQRGLFSSQLDLVVKPIDGQPNAWLKPGQTVVLNEKVDHGPFPLAQLKHFNLLPAMASVHTTLANNEVTKPLFDIAKGESAFVADTRIAYDGATRTDLTLRPLNSEQPNAKVAFSGGEFRIDADKDGNTVSVNGEIESALVDAVNEYGQKVQLSMNKFKSEGKTELTSFDERIGNQKTTLDKLAVSIENKEMAVLEGMELNAKSDVGKDKKTIDSQIDYTLNSLKVQNQDMGSGKLTLKIGQIDAKAWRQFSQQYNGQVQALMAQPEVVKDPQLYQQKVTEAFLGAFPLLLKGEPVVTIAPLSWKNGKGETAFNLSLFLKDPATATTAPQSVADQLDRSVKSLDSKLTIPVDMATEFMTQVAKLEGYQGDQAEKLAQQQVKGLAAMGQMFRITTMDNNTITTSLQYANGQVTLNGQKMPLEEFIGMFAMPALPAVPGQPAVPPTGEPATPPAAPAVPQQ